MKSAIVLNLWMMNGSHDTLETDVAEIRQPRVVSEPADEGKDVVGTNYNNI